MSHDDIPDIAQNISAVERETGLSKDVLRMKNVAGQILGGGSFQTVNHPWALESSRACEKFRID